MRRRTAVGFLLWLVLAPPAAAHWSSPGYLEIKPAGPGNYAVLWKVPLQSGRPLRITPVLPDGCTEQTPIRSITLDTAMIQRWLARCDGGLAGGTIEMAGLPATVTDVLARIYRSDGTVQTVRLTGDSPSLVVTDSPDWLDVARTYLALGFDHILAGVDHLLFVAALLIIVAGWRRLVATVTAFTIAHSVTLAAATLGWVRIPFQPIEAVIALSIVALAVEVVRHNATAQPAFGTGLTYRWPWMVAFTFGLLHGIGFASALIDVGLPENAIPLALLFFNIGVELGQLLFVALFLATARFVGRVGPVAATRARAAAGYVIGTVAAYWTIERVAGFWS